MTRMYVLVFALAACGAPPAQLGNASHAPVAWGDATVAVFEPVTGGCVLRRRDPVAAVADDMARFDHDCRGARIAWRDDLERAVVWFDPSNRYVAGYAAAGASKPSHDDEDGDDEIVERLYEIDLVVRVAHPLRRPTEEVREYAYGTGGKLLAFVEHDLPDARHTKVAYRGRMLDFTAIQEGMAAAAVVLAHAGDNWQLVSVTETTTGWDYAAGWAAAPEAQHLGPRSEAALEAHAATVEPEAGARGALARIAASDDDRDGWARLEALPVFVWMVTAEFTYTTGRIAWSSPDGAIAPLPDLGFTGGELVAITTRGRYLLVASSSAGAFPRLYDLASHRRVFASETARSTMFWPRALAAETAR